MRHVGLKFFVVLISHILQAPYTNCESLDSTADQQEPQRPPNRHPATSLVEQQTVVAASVTESFSNGLFPKDAEDSNFRVTGSPNAENQSIIAVSQENPDVEIESSEPLQTFPSFAYVVFAPVLIVLLSVYLRYKNLGRWLFFKLKTHASTKNCARRLSGSLVRTRETMSVTQQFNNQKLQICVLANCTLTDKLAQVAEKVHESRLDHSECNYCETETDLRTLGEPLLTSVYDDSVGAGSELGSDCGEVGAGSGIDFDNFYPQAAQVGCKNDDNFDYIAMECKNAANVDHIAMECRNENVGHIAMECRNDNSEDEQWVALSEIDFDWKNDVDVSIPIDVYKRCAGTESGCSSVETVNNSPLSDSGESSTEDYPDEEDFDIPESGKLTLFPKSRSSVQIISRKTRRFESLIVGTTNTVHKRTDRFFQESKRGSKHRLLNKLFRRNLVRSHRKITPKSVAPQEILLAKNISPKSFAKGSSIFQKKLAIQQLRFLQKTRSKKLNKNSME